MGREDEIRMIAYALWVQDGYSHGRAIEHWLRAEAIWESKHKGIVKPGLLVEEQNEEPDEVALSGAG